MLSVVQSGFVKFLIEFRKEFPNCSPCHCPSAWAPPEMGPWLSNDECGAFSAAMSEEFCLPELVDLAETFDGLGMHCSAPTPNISLRASRRYPTSTHSIV